MIFANSEMPMRGVSWLGSLGFAWVLTAAAAGEGPTAPLRYRLDPEGSVLRWELPATMHTVHGRVPKFHGKIEAGPGSAGELSVRSRIVVEAAPMWTGIRRRDRTMWEKVLEADRFPEIVFEASRVTGDLSRFQKGESFSVNLAGYLTVRGKSMPVELPVDVYVFADHVVLAGSFPLHWKQYGLHDPSFGLIRVKEPMLVIFRLRAVPF